MTLLETIVAFVLLSVVGVACLDLARGATSLEQRSAAWSRAVAIGESAADAAAVNAPLDDPSFNGVRIVRRPWAQNGAIEQIDVVVTMPDRTEFRLTRLVARPGRQPGAVR